MIGTAAYGPETGIEEYDDIAAAEKATGTSCLRASGASQAESDAVAEALGLHALAPAEFNTARRDLLTLRKLAWPTREAVGVLARGDVGDGVPRARDAGLLPGAGLSPSAPVAPTRSLGGRPRPTWYERRRRPRPRPLAVRGRRR